MIGPRMIGRRAAGLGLGGLLLGANARAETVNTAPPLLPPAPPFLPPAPSLLPPAPSLVPPAPPLVPPAPPLVPPGVLRSPVVVTLMGSTLIGTYTKIADDIARMLGLQAPNLPRVLPIVAQGGLQVVWDVADLERIDSAVLSGVVLDVVRRGGWLPDLTQRLSYVTLLYFEETHIVSSQLIQDVYSLAGRTVNVGPLGGGTDVIARRLFELLGIQPIFDNRPTLDALQGAPTGDPAAVLFVAGKPVQAFRDIQIVGNLRLVPIPFDAPRRHELEPYFRSTFLVHDDYPRLVPVDTRVPTVASPVFMVVNSLPQGSPRQRAISLVVTELVQNLISLQYGPYHPKWSEANVLIRLPGFRRAPEVMAWFNNSDNPGQ
jgi:TRAP-type uncharacterized transport system substrate-binding protein